jgi:hypothetical protein
MSEPRNTNCLTGFRCPACKSPGPFSITVEAVFTFHDDGAGDHGAIEYDGDSCCACIDCDFDGIVRDFQTEEQP